MPWLPSHFVFGSPVSPEGHEHLKLSLIVSQLALTPHGSVRHKSESNSIQNGQNTGYLSIYVIMFWK